MKEEKKSQIVKNLRTRIFERYNLNQIDNDALEDAIKQLVVEEVKDEYITIEERIDITERIFDSIRGLGLLDSIIKDDEITEVMINGPDDIFVEKAGALYKLDQDRKSVV